MLLLGRVLLGHRLPWVVLGIVAIALFALRPGGRPAEAVVPPPPILTQTFSGILNVKLGQTSTIGRPVTVTVTSRPGLGSSGGYNGDITEVMLSTNVVPIQGDLRVDTRTAGWLRQIGATSKFTLNTPSSAAGEVYINNAWRQIKKTSSITTLTAKFTNGGSRLQLTISGQAWNGTTNIAVEGSVGTSGLDAAPVLVGTIPANGSGNNSVATTVQFVFSEPVSAPASAFTLICGIPVTFTLNDAPNSNFLELVPTSAFPPGGSCTATVNLAFVSDEDSIDPPDTGSGIESVTFTLDLPPSVVTTSPHALSPLQATDRDIVVTFSEPVNFTGSSFQLECGSGPVSFVLNASPAMVVTLNPNGLLPAGATCNLTVVANQVTDVDALDPPDTMAANYGATFFTDALPSLVAFDPDGGTVASDRQVVLTFSEAISLDAGALAVTCGASPQAIVPNVSANVVTIPAPAVGWPAGITCTLTGDQTKVHDADTADPPDTLAAGISKSFSIDAAPAVTSTVPAHLQNGFATNANLVVNFSEQVNVAAGSMTLVCDSVPIAVSGIPASNTNQVTLQHAAPLGVNCTLTILAPGVTDADAIDPPNNLPADVVVTFVTDVPPTAVNDSATVSEDATASAVAVLGNDTDPDGGPISVTSVTQPANGAVVITGGGTGLAYLPNPNYCNTPPGTTLDTFTYTVSPGGSTATVSMTVTCIDDNPTSVADSATVMEDSGATAVAVLGNDTDPDGGAISIASVTQPANGAVVITGGGTGLTYAPNADYCNQPPGNTPDTFTYTLIPSGSSTTVTMTVTCVDDNPTAVADSATVLENASASAINVLANDTDVDGGPKSVTSVTQPANGTVVITGGGTGLTYQPNANYCNNPPGTTLDTFTYTLTPGGSSTTVTVTVTCFDDPPTAVADAATVLEDSGANAINVLANDTDPDGGPISITSVTQPANGTVVITGGGSGLTYAPNAGYCNNPPGTTLDTFTYSLTPAGPTPTATVSMTVTCVNDAPTAGAAAHDVTGNVSITVAAPGLRTGALDEDDTFGALTAELVNLPANSGNLTINPDGSYTFDPPAGVFSGTIVATFRICDDESPTPACSAATNLTFTLSDGVFFVNNNSGACASNCDGRLSHPFTSLASFQAVNNNTGNNPGNGDSIFVYESAAAYTGGVTLLTGQKLIGQDASASLLSLSGITLAADSATLPSMNTAGGTVTLTSTANVVTLGTNNLVRGMTIGDSGSGAKINGVSFGTLTVGNTTTPDVTLNGNGRALKLETGVLAATSAFASVTSATNPSATDQSLRLVSLTGSLAMGSTTVTASNIQAIFVNATTANLDFGNTSIGGTSTNEAIRLESNTGGTRTFGTLGITNAATIGLLSGGASGGGNVNVTGLTTITNPGTNGINIALLASGTTHTFNGVTVTQSGGTAILVVANVGNVSFGDLNLTPDSSQSGFSATGVNSGSISSTNVGTTGITTTNASAIDVSTTGADTPVNMSFDTVSVTGGGVASTGIQLTNTFGTVTVLGGSIAETSGADIIISSGAQNFSYDGTITDDQGSLVSVSSETGGTKDFNGAITDGNDGDGSGITLSNNSGATIRFDGGLTLSTSSSAAFAATGGGTVIVTDPASGANTITTTSGTALNVTNTTIGTGGLVFERVSSTGAASGIILNTTGTTAGLTVTGTGSGTTGGTIQSSTGAGVSLTSTGPTSLSFMSIANGGSDGIFGSDVRGLTLATVSVTSNGNAVGENGIEIADLTGTGSMSNVAVSGSGENNVVIANAGSGTLTSFNVTTSSFLTTNMTTGDDGFRVENNGSGAMTLSITGSTFTDNKGDHFQVSTTASATGSVNFTFSGNTLSTTAGNDPNVVGGGVTVSPSGSADITFTVANNNIQEAFDEALNFNLGTASTASASMIGTISNNVIGSAGVVDSGSESGSGISVISNGAGRTIVSITGNQVYQYANPYGILVNTKEGSSNLDATVTGNTVANPGTFALNGIRVDAGATAGDSGTLCAAVTGNSVAGSGPGLDVDIRLRQRFNTTFKLPGYGGANTNDAAVVTFVTGNNAGSDASAINNVAGGGGGYVGGAACVTP